MWVSAKEALNSFVGSLSTRLKYKGYKIVKEIKL